MENGYRFYSPGGPSKQVVVYVHSLTQDDRTPFAEFIIKRLIDSGVSVYSFTFDFLKSGNEPSPDLSKEKEELRLLVKYVRAENEASRLSLVGKSLGGVVGLKLALENKELSIGNVHVLGFPLALGYPPRLNLLRGATLGKFDGLQEYVQFLASLETPVSLIQGGADDLGPVQACTELAKSFPSLMSLDVIPQANHSFMVGTANAWEECAEALVKRL